MAAELYAAVPLRAATEDGEEQAARPRIAAATLIACPRGRALRAGKPGPWPWNVY